MDISGIKQPLARFNDALSKHITVDELIVFGSYLHGNATDESDIDVFVVSENFNGMSEDDRMKMLDEVAEGIEPTIEAWGLTSSELAKASKLTTTGQARDKGIKFYATA